jgi:glycine cleavage system H protein
LASNRKESVTSFWTNPAANSRSALARQARLCCQSMNVTTAAGTRVEKGQPFGEVESTKSVSDLYSPVTGKVVRKNASLAETPELVNRDPYGEGWLIVIEPSDPGQLEGLMDAGAYRRLVEEADQGG